MLGRYAELKAQLPPETILLYQVGTFFETFEEDAKRISQALSIRLTSREAAGEGRVPGQGRPGWHSRRRGIDRRVHGYRGLRGAAPRRAGAVVAARDRRPRADRGRETAEGTRRRELRPALDVRALRRRAGAEEALRGLRAQRIRDRWAPGARRRRRGFDPVPRFPAWWGSAGAGGGSHQATSRGCR